MTMMPGNPSPLSRIALPSAMTVATMPSIRSVPFFLLGLSRVPHCRGVGHYSLAIARRSSFIRCMSAKLIRLRTGW